MKDIKLKTFIKPAMKLLAAFMLAGIIANCSDDISVSDTDGKGPDYEWGADDSGKIWWEAEEDCGWGDYQDCPDEIYDDGGYNVGM